LRIRRDKIKVVLAWLYKERSIKKRRKNQERKTKM